MANNTIIRTHAVTAGYKPLATSSVVASVDISCLPGNAGVVYFLGDDGSDVAWQPGEWHPFRQVDLSKIFVKGTTGDTVTIIGGTW